MTSRCSTATGRFIAIFTEQEHIDAVCEARVPVVSFHWGHPHSEWIAQLHDAGVRVWEQVWTVADAVRAAEDGVDLVVAQGLEAGGHNYAELPTFVALPAVVDAVDVPVLASGGVSDGRGLAAALALGAAGVWVGTRLVATKEAFVPDGYKQRLLDATGDQTVRTAMFGPETRAFNPMRVLRNTVVDEFADAPERWPDSLEGQPEVGTWRFGPMEVPMHRFTNFVPTAETDADLDQVPLLAGQGVGAIADLPGAGEVVERMAREAEDVLTGLGS